MSDKYNIRIFFELNLNKTNFPEIIKILNNNFDFIYYRVGFDYNKYQDLNCFFNNDFKDNDFIFIFKNLNYKFAIGCYNNMLYFSDTEVSTKENFNNMLIVLDKLVKLFDLKIFYNSLYIESREDFKKSESNYIFYDFFDGDFGKYEYQIGEKNKLE